MKVKNIKLILLLVIACVICIIVAVLVAFRPSRNQEDKIRVISTVFSAYDWTVNIVGDDKADVEVRYLLEKGTDLHSYQPSVSDIAEIASCDLFIYVGGESEKWVDNVLKNKTNKNLIAVNLLEILGNRAKEEEIVEGMQNEEHEHEHQHEHEEIEYDEHVWLSIKNAMIFVDRIASALSQIDIDNAKAYEENAKKYIGKLKDLNGQYEQMIKGVNRKTVVFADRFPFRYLLDDYDISYYAAFPGCSAETEASFETIVFLANKIDEIKAPSILMIENSNDKIARTIRDNTKKHNQKISVLDSLQSVPKKEYHDKNYLDVMEKNLSVLSEALR